MNDITSKSSTLHCTVLNVIILYKNILHYTTFTMLYNNMLLYVVLYQGPAGADPELEFGGYLFPFIVFCVRIFLIPLFAMEYITFGRSHGPSFLGFVSVLYYSTL